MTTLNEELRDKIKDDMIFGYFDDNGKKQYPTLKASAEWYKVSYDSLKQYAKDWNWRQERKKHQAKVKRKVEEKKKSEKISESEAEAIVVDDAKFNDAANKLRRAAVMELDNIISGEVTRSVGYHLMNIGRALESAQKISKTAAGEPSEYTESNVKGEVKGRYEVTKTLICSDEHIKSEIEVLNAVSEAQGLTD